MRKSCYKKNDSIQCTCADVDARPMHKSMVSALDEQQHQHKCDGFESFLDRKTKSFAHVREKLYDKMTLKNINNFTQ